jgi:hypothetical protein
MIRTARLLALLLVVLPRPAAAQARFHTGNFSWTPMVTLREAGLDTNVYDEAADPKRDNLAVVAPQVDGTLQLASATLVVGGAAEFVYFQRYTDERSFNKRGSARIEVPLSRIKPYGALSYADARERQNTEVDLRARRTDRQFTAGLGVQATNRAELELGLRGSDSRYESGEVFRGVDLATRLDHDTAGVLARLRYEVTPLTTFTVEGDASRDRFVRAPDYDIDNVRVLVGFEFAPDAVLQGKALVGYHEIRPQGALALGYDGLTAAVEVGYVLLGRTRLDARVLRETTQSIEAQPYYLRTTYGGEILHNLVGPIDVIGRASRELLEYPGIPERQIENDTLHLTRYGGGLAIRAADRLRFTINYEFATRRGVNVPLRNYDRTRAYTTITYGF